MNVFGVKSVPFVSWSSAHPLNFKPRLTTLLLLSLGLMLFGLGEALLISSTLGVSPWTVLAQGLSLVSGLSIGAATFVISLLVLLLWLPLRQAPGLGTLLNVVIIATALEFTLPLLSVSESVWIRLLQVVAGIFLVGLGSGLYLMAHLGTGPRDGLMTGLQRLTDLPISLVRTGLEIGVVVVGWVLGGTVGLGTLLFALGIGPSVSLGISLVQMLSDRSSTGTKVDQDPKR